MPSLLTHQWFADQILDHVQGDFSFINEHRQVVYLGAQGPDPFFFYGRAPFASRKNKEAMNAFGSYLHNQPLDLTLLKLLKTYHQSDKHPVLTSYVIGALTHYALDRSVHPYVFYRSGFDENGQLTGIYGRDHARLEVAIDNAIKKHFQLSESVYNPRFTLGLSPSALEKISSLYHQTYAANLKEDDFLLSTLDMRRVYDFLYHSGVINRLLVVAVAGKKSLPFGLIHPAGISDTWLQRVLNMTHETWRHPVTYDEHSDDVFAMVDQATTLMEKLLPWIHAMPSHPEIVHESIDYDGKVIGSTYRHFSSYYSR